MSNLFFSNKITRFSTSFLLAASIVLLTGCGGGGGGATAAAGSTTTVNDAIALGTSVTSIKTDNSDSATLTATPTASNAVLPGVIVTFATTSGNLSALTATSDSTGKATVTLSSGATDFSNRTANVTATANGKTASIPVLISGSTLTLAASATTLQVGAGTITVAATAKDAGGIGKNGQTVRFSIDATTSTGAATLSDTTLTTGGTGATANVTLTPTSAGIVVVTAEWLDSSGAVSVTATRDITVTAETGIAFAITTPATDPTAFATSPCVPPILCTQALAVTVPATINGTNVASVRISSTAGTWVGVTQVTAASASITQTPVANAVAATFTASNNSGVATVQVDALSAASAVLSTLTRTFVVSAPAATAASLNLQTSAPTIAPSSGSNSSTATLTATVRDASNNSVGNAAVVFELLGTTGSGESISPAVAYTDGTGKATSTFSAGSAPTAGSIYVRARVVGQVCTGSPEAIPAIAETNPLCGSVQQIVASTAVSISLGFGTTITDTASATQYLLPGSVLVVNSNGSPVAAATVTLTVFPFEYRNGTIGVGALGCIAPATTFVASEDVNRNGILDTGEDTPVLAAQTPAQIAAGAISINGVLSPPQAAGGAIPVTVITDSNGAATFNLQYPKSSAFFIRDEVTARVTVSGTERSAQTTFTLPMSVADGNTVSVCTLARTATY